MTMLPTPPECGSPCGECEALAHLNDKLRTNLQIREQRIAQLHATANALAEANGKLAESLGESEGMRIVIQRTVNWLYDHSPLAIWRGHVNGEPRVEILKTNGDAEIVRENGAWVVLGSGATLVEAVANAEESP